MSVVMQGRVLGTLLVLAYINDIWKNIESTTRVFVDDCVICRKRVNNNDRICKSGQTGGVGAGKWDKNKFR